MVVTSASSSFSLVSLSLSSSSIIQVLRIKNANICEERDARYLAMRQEKKKENENFAHTF